VTIAARSEHRPRAAAHLDPLDDPASYRRLDPTGMLRDIARADRPFRETAPPPESIRTDRVLVAGMGASGVVGDVLQSLAQDEGAIPVAALHGATLSRWHDRQDLLVAVSYSGETREVLSVAEQAHARGGQIVAISSGGRLSDWAQQRDVSVLRVRAGSEPRAAFSALLAPALMTCVRAGVFPDVGFASLASDIEDDNQRFRQESPLRANPAKHTAHRLLGRTPIFAAAGHLSPVAARWSAQWAENAKLTSIPWVAPDILHNAVEALDDLATGLLPCVVIFRDVHLSAVDTMSLDLLARVCQERGMDCLVMEGQGTSRLSSLLHLIQLGDFASGYLGILRGQRIAELSIIPELRSALRQADALPLAS
jgi:glucose/mannose-6-phosphate isomerase